MRFRLILSLLLSLGLALTGGTMAVMRGQMAQTTTLVICTGHGVAMVTLDVDGNPVEALHPCADCTLTLAVQTHDLPSPTSRPLRWSALPRPVELALPVSAPWVAVLARGPPSVQS